MVSCFLVLAGCSKAVVIPRDELVREEYRTPGDYRIRLQGWNEYHARRFSVTDSTIVIHELKHSDDHYALKRHEMPIVIPRDQVEHIGEMKTNWPVTTGVVLGITAVVWALASFFGDLGPIGN